MLEETHPDLANQLKESVEWSIMSLLNVELTRLLQEVGEGDASV
jgi:hypothetical protein